MIPDVKCTVVVPEDPIDACLVDRVLGEYWEMPGLALTIDQARRLWGCDAVTCRRIADVLVDSGRPRVLCRQKPSRWSDARASAGSQPMRVSSHGRADGAITRPIAKVLRRDKVSIRTNCPAG